MTISIWVRGYADGTFEVKTAWDGEVLAETWIGKSLEELNVRRNHGVNVIGLREGDDVDVTPDPRKPLKRDMTLILIGANADLKKFAKYEKNE